MNFFKNLFFVAIKFFSCIARFFYEKIIKPRSINEDLRRREFILNVLLLAFIFLLAIFSAFIFYRAMESGVFFNGMPFHLFFLIFLIFIVLYFLSRLGFFNFVSYFFLISLFLLITYSVYFWGVDLPQSILSYALVIVMAGVLISTRFSFLITLLISLSLLLLGYFQINGIIAVNSYWRKDLPTMSNIIEFFITLLIIATVSWLSNREIEKSLLRARKSEKELKKEKDSLEDKIRERTREIQKMQLDKTRNLYKFAEFGKMSSGIFHDLSNHLAAFFLNLEKINPKDRKKTKEARQYLTQARNIMHKTEDFIGAVQKQLRKEGSLKKFSLNKEIEQIVQIFSYKANEEGIEIIFQNDEEIEMFGDAIGFNQIATNLISNAIDACARNKKNIRKREIKIMLRKMDREVFFAVRDSGCGIKKEFQSKIFKPFFTTKEFNHGVGIGLSSIEEIIDKKFLGTIDFESEEGKGSKFVVNFPLYVK